MGILDRLLNPTEQRSLRNPTADELLALRATPTTSGVSVTPESALAYSAVLSCVRILSETTGTLPLVMYEQMQPRGKRRATEHRLYGLLHDAPNPAMTRFEWITTVMGHLTGWGNHYSERQIDGAGRTIALWPLHPGRMEVSGSPVTGLVYKYNTGNDIVPLREDQVLHFRGLGADGVRGYSVLRLAKEAIGLGMATQEYGARWFGNGARPTVVMVHPGRLSDKARDNLVDSWNANHQGLSNAHRAAVLEEGIDIKTIGIPPEDSQFLQTRKFQRVEIAAMFRVPPYMIGEMDGAIKANVEQQSLDLWQSIVAWLVCIEQRCGLSLLSAKERSQYLFKFLADGLVRADIEARYRAYGTGITGGWLSPDEVREKDDMNPMPNGIGRVYLRPANMVAVDENASQSSPAGEPPAQRSVTDTAERRAVERRAVGASRQRLAKTYRSSLSHTAQRIVNREVNDLANARERFSKQADGVAEFRQWFQRWLEGHDAVVLEYLEPTLRTYANLVVAELERELDRDIPGNIETFEGDYISGRSDVWMGKLRHGVNNIAYAEDDDPWLLMDDFLAKRKEGYAESFAHDETVRFGNALARTAYQLVGILSMMWIASGAETCPYCAALDGMTVSTQSNFLPAGNELKPGDENAFVSDSNIGHPPLHNGCDCMIVAA